MPATLAKPPKQQKTPKPVKETVVSFRLTRAETTTLKETFAKQPMAGVRSHNMLARKLALDWAAGRLHYKNKRDELLAPEVNQASQ